MNRYQKISQTLVTERRRNDLGIEHRDDLADDDIRERWHDARIARLKDRLEQQRRKRWIKAGPDADSV